MKDFEFTIIASGLDRLADDFEDRFWDNGCDDASISFQKGVIILEFCRTAPSFSQAIASAFKNVHAAGATIERVEPDHLVSLTDIGERMGSTRAAASNYARGARGEDFPAPAVRVTSDHPLWDWYEVALWLFQRGKIDREEVLRAKLVKEANLYVDARNLPHDAFVERLEEAERDLEGV